MISIISSMRFPRVFQSWKQTSKSSGHGLVPTPKLKRSFVITATDVTDFATSTGERIGSFTTKVEKRIFEVTAPSVQSDANHPQAVADSVADFWTLLRDLDARGQLPTDIFALEIGSGSVSALPGS